LPSHPKEEGRTNAPWKAEGVSRRRPTVKISVLPLEIYLLKVSRNSAIRVLFEAFLRGSKRFWDCLRPVRKREEKGKGDLLYSMRRGGKEEGSNCI